MTAKPRPASVAASRAVAPEEPSFARILFPTDLSPESLQAFPYATSLARRFGGQVVVLYLISEGDTSMHQHHGYTTDAAVSAGVLTGAEMRLAEHLEELSAPGVPLELEVAIVPSLPAGIATAALAHGADAVVMATHARTGLGHLLRGSVTEETVRSVACPVLVIRTS